MNHATATPRLLVMLSGGGRTAINLLDAIDDRRLRATIVRAIASKPCSGIARLESRGIPVDLIEGELPAETLNACLRTHRIDLVALCGYLRYVHVPPGFEGRIINIHPSLLPRHGGPGFFGTRVHRAALQAGDRESGCTVHVVDAHFDHGPIILQKRCPVLPGDTPESLAGRVFELECQAYPEALQLVLDRLVPNAG